MRTRITSLLETRRAASLRIHHGSLELSACDLAVSNVPIAMGHNVLDTLRGFIADYGYWAVALALLLENAGIPVPGETALLLAGFLAYSEQKLHLGWIIVVGTCAATVGDNLGYMIGHYGGRPLLERYQRIFPASRQAVERGEKLFARYGSVTILFARFVFGMRIIAGPLAGILRMPWKTFAIFNMLGAALWVTVIAIVGYLFGRNWEVLMRAFKEFDLAVLAIVVALVILWWWRRRRLSG
jgi:membrane protein DedA with SNARE-associated domain